MCSLLHCVQFMLILVTICHFVPAPVDIKNLVKHAILSKYSYISQVEALTFPPPEGLRRMLDR
jgi:hypothetical protein